MTHVITARNIACPECNYDVGLTTRKCPKCGFEPASTMETEVRRRMDKGD